MREILITFLLFGLAVLLAATRYKQGSTSPVTKRNTLTDDRATTKSQQPVETTTEPQSVAETVAHAVKDTTAPADDSGSVQPVTIVAPMLELEPEVTLPLAASLPLQDVIKPATTQAEAIPDLEPKPSIVEATADSNTQKAEDRDYRNVLEEIAHLSEGNHEATIATLRRYAHHASPMIRATAAMTLGDLAAKNQEQPQETIAALLNELLHDSNSEVQLQAAAALGKMQLPGNLT